MDLFDILFDENNHDDILMYSADGEGTVYRQIAIFHLEYELYCILVRVNNILENECNADIYRYVSEDDEESLVVEEDVEIRKIIIDMYTKMKGGSSEWMNE